MNMKKTTMKYSPELFIKNIEYLVNYGYEPEIEITLHNDNRIFIIAYKEFVDYYDKNDNYQKFFSIREAVEKIDFTRVLSINDYSNIDLSRPIEEQSMLIDGVLWIKSDR